MEHPKILRMVLVSVTRLLKILVHCSDEGAVRECGKVGPLELVHAGD